jgi:branched-chain amino acid aminotransferase
MIWVRGELVPDDSFSISIADRTFEHGLGLFETLRTREGRPSLIEAHRERMMRSAEALGLSIGPASFPDAQAVGMLLEAEGAGEDRLLRITATGGIAGESDSVVWMRSGPLPPESRPGGSVVSAGTWQVAFDDPIARHKALNYWSRRIAFERARARGEDEALGSTADGRIWEGSRTSLFAVEGDRLLTPSLEGPIVPGVMRRLVLDIARSLPWEVREVAGIERTQLLAADEVFLTNSVRGIIPVGGCDGRTWTAPGRWTGRLQAMLADHLYPREVLS